MTRKRKEQKEHEKEFLFGGVRKKGILKRKPFKKEREKEGTRGFLFVGVRKKERKKECTT
jgi:hypothetical protein